MFLEDILSIVLPNCPSTALAKMNFGWSILGSYLSTFLISFSFQLSIQKPERLNFKW